MIHTLQFAANEDVYRKGRIHVGMGLLLPTKIVNDKTVNEEPFRVAHEATLNSTTCSGLV